MRKCDDVQKPECMFFTCDWGSQFAQRDRTGRWEGRRIQEQHRRGFSNDEVKSDRRVSIWPNAIWRRLASRYHVCLINETLEQEEHMEKISSTLTARRKVDTSSTSKYGSVQAIWIFALYGTSLFPPQKRRREAPAPNIYIHGLSSRFSISHPPAPNVRSSLGADDGLLHDHGLQILPLRLLLLDLLDDGREVFDVLWPSTLVICRIDQSAC